MNGQTDERMKNSTANRAPHGAKNSYSTHISVLTQIYSWPSYG